MNSFLFTQQRVTTDKGPRLIAPLPPTPKTAPPPLAPGDIVLTSMMRPQAITAVTPNTTLTEAVMLSVMSDEQAGRALSLLCGLDCQVLVENAWVSAGKVVKGNKIATLSANGKHPHIGIMQSAQACGIRAGQGVGIQVAEDNSLFMNGIAVRCPA